MIKELVTDREKLSERSKEWDVTKDPEFTAKVITDLKDTLLSLEDRLYLTAKEIGYDERAAVFKFAKNETLVILNPMYYSKEDLKLSRELDTLNGKEYFIPRFSNVSLVYQDKDGKAQGNKFSDTASVVISKCMDTLDGLFTSDYGLEIIPEFDEASEEEKEEVIKAYIESLTSFQKELDTELSEDEELKDQWKAVKFMRAVADGEVELEKISAPELSNRKKKKLLKLEKLFKRKGRKV